MAVLEGGNRTHTGREVVRSSDSMLLAASPFFDLTLVVVDSAKGQVGWDSGPLRPPYSTDEAESRHSRVYVHQSCSPPFSDISTNKYFEYGLMGKSCNENRLIGGRQNSCSSWTSHSTRRPPATQIVIDLALGRRPAYPINCPRCCCRRMAF